MFLNLKSFEVLLYHTSTRVLELAATGSQFTTGVKLHQKMQYFNLSTFTVITIIMSAYSHCITITVHVENNTHTHTTHTTHTHTQHTQHTHTWTATHCIIHSCKATLSWWWWCWRWSLVGFQSAPCLLLDFYLILQLFYLVLYLPIKLFPLLSKSGLVSLNLFLYSCFLLLWQLLCSQDWKETRGGRATCDEDKITDSKSSM